MKKNKSSPNSAPGKWRWPVLGWTLAACLAGASYMGVSHYQSGKPAEVSASAFMKQLSEGGMSSVEFDGNRVLATMADGKKVKATLLPGSDMVKSVAQVVPEVRVLDRNQSSGITAKDAIFWGLATLMGVMLFGFLIRNRAESNQSNMGGPAGMSAFITGKSRRVMPSSQSVKFADVAGCDEAKAELVEVVEFLKDGEKFKRLGGKMPRGVLLVGPPGTGKTLLAKAVAGEAGVPYFTISGSEFVEMYVGVGAARVRQVFSEAKRHGTAILFIDEIDSIGRSRSGGGGSGGSDEQEQALNQLLVEMNGFDSNSNVIVLAATNRLDVLDEALTRPGRFDRRVIVDLPDVHGREDVLRVHLRSIPLDADVAVDKIAKSTPGFSGADLQNLVNEAALMAGREDATRVKQSHFEKAMDKVTMGLERKTNRHTKADLLSTAYHEAGHALLANLLPGCDPVHKVSIVPRGQALGVTVQLPERDKYSLSRTQILSDIKVLFGGRIAEDLFTEDVTTGASNDYERANSLARNFVARWGMSEAVGPLMTVAPYGMFGQRGSAPTVSEQTLHQVDVEVAKMLRELYDEAKALIENNSDVMHSMAAALMQHETIDGEMVQRIIKRELKFDTYVL